MTCPTPMQGVGSIPPMVFHPPKISQTESRVVSPQELEDYTKAMFEAYMTQVAQWMNRASTVWGNAMNSQVGPFTVDPTTQKVRDPDYASIGAGGSGYTTTNITEENYSAAVGDFVCFDNGADMTPHTITLPAQASSDGKAIPIAPIGGYTNLDVVVQSGDMLDNITDGTQALDTTGVWLFVCSSSRGWFSASPA